MEVAVLVIGYRGEDHITLHDNEAKAWLELLRFINDRWASDPATGSLAKPAREEDLVKFFFEAECDSYLIGSADVSEFEALFAASLRDDRHDS